MSFVTEEGAKEFKYLTIMLFAALYEYLQVNTCLTLSLV